MNELDTSIQYAVELTKSSGSNFHLAFRVLPRPMYQAMCVIYAFMRLSDDLVDEESADARQKLRDWRSLIESLNLHSDDSVHPLFPALMHVMTHYPIDLKWLLAVLDGMEQDLKGESFQTWEDLRQYCDRVAGMPGLCCQAIWGADLDVTHELALQCGRAFQLTNILRDLREDAMRDRCYLPLEECEQFGWSPLSLKTTQPAESAIRLVQFQIERAKQLYADASQLDSHLQGPGRRMFRIMFCTYRAILKQIEQTPERVFSERVEIGSATKLKLLCVTPFLKIKAD